MRQKVKSLCCSLCFIVAFASPSCAFGGIIGGPIVYPANGHTYYLLTEASWTVSEAEAISLGGHLTTINDEDENTWLATEFPTHFPGAPLAWVGWIGFNDVDLEGTFIWASGEPVTYTHWSSGEPNDYGSNLGGPGEDYVILYRFGEYRWNDTDNAPLNQGRTLGIVEIDAQAVPEPSSALLMFAGAAMLFIRRIYRRREQQGATR
jgi:hypothetical protein